MAGFALALVVVSFIGGFVQRWVLLPILAGVWALLLVVSELTGGLEYHGWSPAMVAVVGTLVVLVPLEIAATIGIVSGRHTLQRSGRG